MRWRGVGVYSAEAAEESESKISDSVVQSASSMHGKTSGERQLIMILPLLISGLPSLR